MHRKGSRCGIVTRARFGRRASTLALLALLGLLVSALPASGSQAPGAVAGSATIVIHGQGRVTSEPAGAIDCPTTCSFTFAGSTTLTLRAAPASGYATAEIASCAEVDVCTVPLNDFAYTINVYFRPRAKLQLWPNGDGAINVSPPPADFRGEPTAASCTPANSFEGTGCEFYYLPGTPVTATASPQSRRAAFSASARTAAPRPASARSTLSRDSSLVARFTPLEVRVIRGGNGTGSITSEPSGIACPPTCTAPFPAGSQVTLVASPDAGFALPQLEVRLHRVDHRPAPLHPHRDEPSELGRRRARRGRRDRRSDHAGGALRRCTGREGSDQGHSSSTAVRSASIATCSGRGRSCVASPAGGWRFTQWNGACGKAATCSLYIGPVTTVGALFTENLAPQLQSVKATGRSGRKLTVRLSVRHAAQVRLQLRRDGAAKVLADRRFALKGGANAVVLAVPAKVKAGRFRLTISVSDGLGGGRTYFRVLKVGP